MYWLVFGRLSNPDSGWGGGTPPPHSLPIRRFRHLVLSAFDASPRRVIPHILDFTPPSKWFPRKTPEYPSPTTPNRTHSHCITYIDQTKTTTHLQPSTLAASTLFLYISTPSVISSAGSWKRNKSCNNKNNWKHWNSVYRHQGTSCQCRDTDRRQNLIICSLAHCQHSLKISCKSVRKFLRKVANRQTDKHRRKHNIRGDVKIWTQDVRARQLL